MKRLINWLPLLVLVFFAASSLSCRDDKSIVFEMDADVPNDATKDETSVAHHLETPSQPDVEDSTVSENANADSSFVALESRELFNGRDLDGWTDETGAAPKGWAVKDGVLCLTDPQNGGDIITKDAFDNFIFSFEWRFGEGCNSGVKYKIEQPNGKGWVGLEYQIQDDARVEDGKIDNRKIASLFDVLPAKTTSKANDYSLPIGAEPSGDFRRGKIVVKENHVEHWLDGECVLSFEIGSKEWDESKAKSKFKNQKNFGLIKSSPLLLQCHGYPIEFRNLRLQKLEKQRN